MPQVPDGLTVAPVRNIGLNVPREEYTISSTPLRYGVIALGDYNFDGYPDIALNGGGYVALVSMGPTVHESPGPLVYYPFEPSALFAAGDLNGDRHADLFSVRYSHGTPDGAILFVDGSWQPVAGYASDFLSLNEREYVTGLGAIADSNGDGYCDLVANFFTLVAGGPCFPLRSAQAYVAGLSSPPSRLGDVNGDGADDVLIPYRSPSIGYGVRGAAPSLWTWNDTLQGTPIGDVNGDGYDDLATDTVNEVHIHYGGLNGPSATASVTLSLTP